MIRMLTALALQAAAPPPASPVPAAIPCHLERANAALALGLEAFDQDASVGWRSFAQQPGCYAAAADLIHAYRTNLESHLSILYWHEGQLRANGGQNPEAIGLMEQSRKPDDRYGWNPYVDATIAFLRGDRAALMAARATLAGLPRPAGFEYPWPQNLAVVDGLIRCFGRPYREAYGAPECGEPAPPEPTRQ